MLVTHVDDSDAYQDTLVDNMQVTHKSVANGSDIQVDDKPRQLYNQSWYRKVAISKYSPEQVTFNWSRK